MFLFSSKIRSSLKFLTSIFFVSVLSRTTNIPSTRREWSTATSSSIRGLNDEDNDTTVFHAYNTASKSLHDHHYTHRGTVGLRASDLNTITIRIHSMTSCCEIEDSVEIHLCKLCVIFRSRVLYNGTMHVVAEAGSVRACGLLRREHAANIWPSLCWPWMLG